MANGMLSIAVLCREDYLYRKIELELSGLARCRRVGADEDAGWADAALVELSCGGVKASVPMLTMSYDGEADIALPFRLGTLYAAINALIEAREIALVPDEYGTKIAGRYVQLTEVELLLLRALYRRGGGFATREELVGEVWGDKVGKSALNVYIHYLRKKLEVAGGDGVIICSRKLGYAIDKRYLGGTRND